MAPGRPAVGTKSRNEKAYQTVFKRGAEAARSGKTLSACPYPDTSERAGHVSFGRKWRTAWIKGFHSVKKKDEPLPP